MTATWSEETRPLCLNEAHAAMEATLAPEAGYRVPMAYCGPLDEASRVRRRGGIFDLSHYGRLRIRGDGALELLERACTVDVAHQEDETTVASLLCNERGGIVDHVRLIRLAGFWVLVTSPPCREKVLAHLQAIADAEGIDATIDDQTDKTVLLAALGPEAQDVLSRKLPFDLGGLAPGEVKFGQFLIAKYIAERIDVFGLWGLTVQLPNLAAAQAWKHIAGADDDSLAPAGQAAWDVLRIEAGQPRYGHELNETIDPALAHLMDHVDFEHRFIGFEAVGRASEASPAQALIGLSIRPPDGAASMQAVPRQGSSVLDAEGNEAGTVTSGTLSAERGEPIAMAYVRTSAREPFRVETPGGTCDAVMEHLPFV